MTNEKSGQTGGFQGCGHQLAQDGHARPSAGKRAQPLPEDPASRSPSFLSPPLTLPPSPPRHNPRFSFICRDVDRDSRGFLYHDRASAIEARTSFPGRSSRQRRLLRDSEAHFCFTGLRSAAGRSSRPRPDSINMHVTSIPFKFFSPLRLLFSLPPAVEATATSIARETSTTVAPCPCGESRREGAYHLKRSVSSAL